MRGHMRKRGTNWALVVDLDRDPVTNKRRQRWFSGFETKRDAEARLAEIQHSLNTGAYIEPSRLTTGQYPDQWPKDYVGTNVAPSTAQVYEHIIRQHLIPGLGAVPLAKLTPQHVQAYYTDKLERGRLDGKGGLSCRSVRHHHTTLHSALQSALRWGLVARNVSDAADPPRFERKEMRTLDEVGLRRVIQAAKQTPYHALFYIALFTGARRSEVLALRWSDTDLDTGGISITRSVHHLKNGKIVYKSPKTAKSRRQIPLPPSATLVLRTHKDQQQEAFKNIGIPWTEDDLVFVNEIGDPIHPDTVTHAWMNLVRRLGMENIRLHDARHTHASLLLTQGVHPKVVQERLGHATIQITLDTYSHVLPGLQEAAASAFDDGVGIGQADTQIQAAG